MKAKDRRFHIRLEIDEEVGGYTVTIPELQGCVTEGDTFSEALEMIRDAAEGLLIVMDEHGDAIPPQFEPLLREIQSKARWQKAASHR